MITVKEWILIRSGGNYILKADGFEISYQPHDENRIQFFEELFGKPSEETALIKDDKYYILNGNFSKEYEHLIDEGYEACKAFFDSKPEFHSKWSD